MNPLGDLKDFALGYAQSAGLSELDVFDELGFYLVDPPKRYDYPSTPVNSITFGQTGGDGVHYGFVGEVGPESPIVMTVPMAFGRENTIVGENLYEFLCLGCCTSYFWLEQLKYGYEGTVALLQEAADIFYGKVDGSDASDDISVNHPVFKALREQLNLRPWEKVQERLGELNARYADRLVVEKPF